MEIVPLASLTEPQLREAAAFLVEQFGDPGGWDDYAQAAAEVQDILARGFAFAALIEGQLAGWIGGLPEYDGLVWELHPLVVKRDFRRQGAGRALVAAFEAEARARGGLTATLGTDDDTGITSLAHTDLFADVPRHIAAARDLGRGHPFRFYQRLGYVITGLVPDANGPGLPDIIMSKSLRTE